MLRPFATLLALAAGSRLALAVIPDTDLPWTNAPPVSPPNVAATAAPELPPKPAAKSTAKATHTALAAATSAQTTAQMQAALDQLTQSNRQLLDLLKQQQKVLEDMQYDRRLQSRHIQSLEERFEQALQDKHQLEIKVTKLESDQTARPPTPTPEPGKSAPPPAQANAPPPAPETPPASYLPAAPPEGGSSSWHRILALKGDGNRQTDLFAIHGKTWRVLWHNQDKPGKIYANTSALFVNAFPRDDVIPQKVCAKLGSGGDSTELHGPGNYSLKVEASGGTWELAIEEYR